MVVGSQEESPAGHRGRCQGPFFDHVLVEHVEIAARAEHERLAILVHEVDLAIGRDGHDVMDCWSERRAASPELRAGTLALRLRIDAEGHVSAAHVGGIDDDALVECVGNRVLGWTFPAPGGGDCAVVEAPFALGER